MTVTRGKAKATAVAAFLGDLATFPRKSLETDDVWRFRHNPNVTWVLG
jgi:hypothetical protein